MGARIAVMAGGTGGHVFPALAVAEALRAQDAAVFWIGVQHGMEARLVPAHGFELLPIQVEGLRRKGWAQRLRAPLRLIGAVWQAGEILRQHRAQAVLGMGGFVAAPGGLAARALGIPLIIHEQNSIPGLTNQWLARIADRVFESFAGSFPAARGALLSGNPVRAEIAALAPPRERFTQRTGRSRLLVLGGSLGAQALNETTPRALAMLAPEQRPEVLHQAGAQTLEQTRAAYRAAGVEAEITPFIDDMAAVYGWADLALCRAGALTVSELATAGLGAILVPYPFAVDDHQRINAQSLAEIGAARLLLQEQLTAERLSASLIELLSDRAGLLRMAEAAQTLASPDAAAQIAAACLELAQP